MRGEPWIAERLHLEFRIVHQSDMTVDVSLLLEEEFLRIGGQTQATGQDRKWIASIASAARQVHGPARGCGILRPDNLNPGEPNRPCGVEHVAKGHQGFTM